LSSPKLKEFILGILTIFINLVVFWLWYNALPFVAEGKWEKYSDLISPLAGLIMAATFFSLSALFIKNRGIAYLTAVVGMGAPYSFILLKTNSLNWSGPTANVLLVVLVVNIILATLAVHYVRKESELSFGFSVFKFLQTGLPLYFTLFSLIISIFFLTELNEEKAAAILLPQPALEKALEVLSTNSSVVTNLLGLPGLKLKLQGTTDEVLAGLIKERLKSEGVELSRLPPQELARLVAREREEWSRGFGIKLSGKEKFTDVLATSLGTSFRNRIGDLFGSYRRYLPLVSAAAFFLAFKALTFPFYYLTLFLTFLLIKFLLLTRILRRERAEIEVERLTL